MSAQPNFPFVYPAGWTTGTPGGAPLPTTYINGAQIMFSPWDFQVVFFQGFTTPVPEATPGELHQVQVVPEAVQRIVMSPEHAKALRRGFDQNIRVYERQHGRIPNIQVQAPPGQPAPDPNAPAE